VDGTELWRSYHIQPGSQQGKRGYTLLNSWTYTRNQVVIIILLILLKLLLRLFVIILLIFIIFIAF